MNENDGSHGRYTLLNRNQINSKQTHVDSHRYTYLHVDSRIPTDGQVDGKGESTGRHHEPNDWPHRVHADDDAWQHTTGVTTSNKGKEVRVKDNKGRALRAVERGLGVLVLSRE